jgi:hypothetical protein
MQLPSDKRKVNRVVISSNWCGYLDAITQEKIVRDRLAISGRCSPECWALDLL